VLTAIGGADAPVLRNESQLSSPLLQLPPLLGGKIYSKGILEVLLIQSQMPGGVVGNRAEW